MCHIRVRSPVSAPPALTYESVVDAKAYGRPDDIDALYARMRKDDPVVYLQPRGYRPFWAVTRHEDIRFVEQNWKRFAAAPRPTLMSIEEEQQSLADFGSEHPVPTVLTMDGELHRKYRRITNDFFMPRNVNALAPMIEAVARSSVNTMQTLDGECDFATDIAFHFPLKVLCAMVGIPAEDEPKILVWAQRLFGLQDADFGVDEFGRPVSLSKTLSEQGAYFVQIARERRKHPQNDIATVLANAEIDGEPMDERYMSAYFSVLATAGHETTSAVIAGGLRALAEHRDQLARLKEKPGLLDSAVDEMIRWTAPVKHFVRTAIGAMEIGGQTIGDGENAALFYASACRDEEAIENASMFDIERDPSKHLAFGFGPHVCLGQHLAKLEVRAFFGELLPRLEHVESAGEPRMMESILTSGLKSLPIRFTMH